MPVLEYQTPTPPRSLLHRALTSPYVGYAFGGASTLFWFAFAVSISAPTSLAYEVLIWPLFQLGRWLSAPPSRWLDLGVAIVYVLLLGAVIGVVLAWVRRFYTYSRLTAFFVLLTLAIVPYVVGIQHENATRIRFGSQDADLALRRQAAGAGWLLLTFALIDAMFLLGWLLTRRKRSAP